MQPLIQLHNPNSNQRMSIYEDGRIYGNEKGQLLGCLNDETTKDLIDLINSNMYMFKTNPKMNFYNDNIIMYIRDDSRKRRTIRIVGWNLPARLLEYKLNKKLGNNENDDKVKLNEILNLSSYISILQKI